MYFWEGGNKQKKTHPNKQIKPQTKNHKNKPKTPKQPTTTFEKRKGKKNSTVSKRF